MKVTILAPAYNEEDAIDQFVGAVMAHLEDGWEILVVDDGSTDSTPQRLEYLAAANPKLRVVTHEQNAGIGSYALSTSFVKSSVTVVLGASLPASTALHAANVAGESASRVRKNFRSMG